ncbi:MAG: beta-ketoacyl synthase N-terminal-like domain-containing protein, partial [Oceanospirillum sp.]|nr:beta-ketoacyl synthase N-terminal-like domain-containing protein [Oceanospirillum sp.]
MPRRRVVVTGLGLITPLGNSVKDSWDGILAGKSGIAPIEHFDTTGFSTQFGGSIKGFDVSEYMPAKDARKMDPFIHYGIAAAEEALSDSGLRITGENAARIGVA